MLLWVSDRGASDLSGPGRDLQGHEGVTHFRNVLSLQVSLSSGAASALSDDKLCMERPCSLDALQNVDHVAGGNAKCIQAGYDFGQ